MGYNREGLVEKRTRERDVLPRVSVVHQILPWPLFGSVGATRAVDPARAENRAENDVQHLALGFAASLLFFSDVAGGRDNTTKIVPFPTMRRV
jgi:hypothetical protein